MGLADAEDRLAPNQPHILHMITQFFRNTPPEPGVYCQLKIDVHKIAR